jgi:hypothetical protein
MDGSYSKDGGGREESLFRCPCASHVAVNLMGLARYPRIAETRRVCVSDLIPRILGRPVVPTALFIIFSVLQGQRIAVYISFVTTF